MYTDIVNVAQHHWFSRLGKDISVHLLSTDYWAPRGTAGVTWTLSNKFSEYGIFIVFVCLFLTAHLRRREFRVKTG